MAWSEAQKKAAYAVVYYDLKKALEAAGMGFFVFMLPSKAWEMVGIVAGCPDRTHAYAAVQAYIDQQGYGSKISYSQIKQEVDKSWEVAEHVKS